MPNNGNSIVAGLSYFAGDPNTATVASFDEPQGTIVLDPTNAVARIKKTAQGANTAGYADILTSGLTTISSDGAVSIISDTIYLTKGSAATITVAAPGANGIGTKITITTGTDFAHVVTFTGTTLNDGTAGANSTWTSAAVQGSSISVVGVTATKWNVVSFNLGTIAP